MAILDCVQCVDNIMICTQNDTVTVIKVLIRSHFGTV